MLNQENKKLCWEILSKKGIANQQHMVIEEGSELQKAICKMFRVQDKQEYKERYCNYIEELVDVIVMCQQMLLAEKISMEEVNELAQAKLVIALEKAK